RAIRSFDAQRMHAERFLEAHPAGGLDAGCAMDWRDEHDGPVFLVPRPPRDDKFEVRTAAVQDRELFRQRAGPVFHFRYPNTLFPNVVRHRPLPENDVSCARIILLRETLSRTPV